MDKAKVSAELMAALEGTSGKRIVYARVRVNPGICASEVRERWRCVAAAVAGEAYFVMDEGSNSACVGMAPKGHRQFLGGDVIEQAELFEPPRGLTGMRAALACFPS